MDRDETLLLLLSAAVKREKDETNSGENSSNRSVAAVDAQRSTNAESADNNGQEWTPAITDISSLGAKQFRTVEDCEMVNLQHRNGESSEDKFQKVLNICDLQQDTEPVVKCEREMRMSLQISNSTTTNTGSESDGTSAEFGEPGKFEKQATVDNEHEDNYNKLGISHLKVVENERTHSCQYCEKRFSHMSSLKRHETAHAGIKIQVCPICGKQFTENSDMNLHVRRHTGEKPYTCSECDKHFTSAGELTRHKKIHGGEKPYACAYCEMRFIRKSDLLIHVQRHNGEKPFACAQCGKRFTTKGERARHEIIHSAEKPYDCPYCEKRFGLNSNLKVHVRRHLGQKPYACTQCDNRFAGHTSLVRHMITHSGEKRYECQHCHIRFELISSLRRHVSKHKDEKPQFSDDKTSSANPTIFRYSDAELICKMEAAPLPIDPTGCGSPDSVENPNFSGTCPITYTVLSESIHASGTGTDTGTGSDHRPVESGKRGKQVDDGYSDSQSKIAEKEKLYSCHYSENKYSFNDSLKRHEKTHSGVKPHACQFCEKQFTHSGDMKQHVRRHTGVKPYACSECDKHFTSKGELTRHMMTHSGEKPYVCPYCEKRFGRNSNLKEHVRRHLGQKPYACTQCDNRFAGHTSLIRHMITHSGEKRYECQHCHIRFGLISSLRRHVSKHKDEKPQFCDDKMSATPTHTHSPDLKSPPRSGSDRHPVQPVECGKRGKQAAVDNGHSDNYNKPIDSQAKAAEKEKSYPCQYCEKSFYFRNSLKRHELTHSGGKPYVCLFCEHSFYQSSHLKEHTRIHTGEKPYICLECGKNFTARTTLSNHMMIHGGERPFVCPFCEKRFVRLSYMRKHVSRHQNSMLFACTHCNSRFALRTELIQHLLIHGGERAHECHYCRKRFLYLCRLKKHMTSHTEAMAQAQPCGESADMDQTSTTNIQSESGKVERHWLPVVKNEAEESAAVSNSAKCHQRVGDDHGEADLPVAIESQEPVEIMEDSKLLLNVAGRNSDAKADDCQNQATATVDEIPMSRDYGERRHDCDNCPSRCPVSISQLQQHSLTDDAKAAYECEECRTRFTDYGELLWHWSVHAQENHSRQLVTTLKQEPMNYFTD